MMIKNCFREFFFFSRTFPEPDQMSLLRHRGPHSWSANKYTNTHKNTQIQKRDVSITTGKGGVCIAGMPTMFEDEEPLGNLIIGHFDLIHSSSL